MRRREIHILLVDDDEDDYTMFKGMIADIHAKWSVEWASSYDLGAAAIQRREHDVCFLDYRLGRKTGLDLLRESIAQGCKMPLVLLTGYGETEVDIEAMRIGAADYLVKDQVDSADIERCIRYAIHRAETLASLRQRESEVLMQDRLASIGLLASSLAHEIGTPLGVIRGRAEFLGIQLKGNEQVEKNVEVITSQIDRVSALIRSLLNLARGDSSRGKSEIVLNEVVNEVVALMGHELRKSEIRLENGIADNVLVRVNAEASSLHQVFLNLLVNSIHAVDSAVRKQGREGNHFIRLSAREDFENWIVDVTDSGCGISKANMRELFKPFFTTKELGAGTGLGLVTSYRIVESWGGTIQVESEEGKGTTFRLILPKSTVERKGL